MNEPEKVVASTVGGPAPVAATVAATVEAAAVDKETLDLQAQIKALTDQLAANTRTASFVAHFSDVGDHELSKVDALLRAGGRAMEERLYAKHAEGAAGWLESDTDFAARAQAASLAKKHVDAAIYSLMAHAKSLV